MGVIHLHLFYPRGTKVLAGRWRPSRSVSRRLSGSYFILSLNTHFLQIIFRTVQQRFYCLYKRQLSLLDILFIGVCTFLFVAQMPHMDPYLLYKSNETPTWCNTVQVLFLQRHSTCFGRKRPTSGVFKTSTAATGTCVIVAGKSSHLLIRAGRPAINITETTYSYQFQYEFGNQ